MSVKGPAFIDTNILVYLYDQESPDHRKISSKLLGEFVSGDGVAISTQVLQEFYVTVTRKLSKPLSESEASTVLRQLSQLPLSTVSVSTVLAAAEGSRQHKLSFWDSLILESAIDVGCTTLFSQDMQDGFVYRDVIVVSDPYKDL